MYIFYGDYYNVINVHARTRMLASIYHRLHAVMHVHVHVYVVYSIDDADSTCEYGAWCI